MRERCGGTEDTICMCVCDAMLSDGYRTSRCNVYSYSCFMDCQIVLWLSNIAAVAIRNFNVESEELILKKICMCG